MNHTVLARKWRPKKFADLVGQKTTVTILQNIIATGRLHHAYLLTGTRGVGKTTIARIIAKALNCLNPLNNEPCGSCNNCQEIDSGRMVDVIEIDAASNTGVDNIREVIENAQYAPTSGKYKIYIIDEVHMLSKSAFNAMLKTLEEPPAHVIFILATTDPHKVPITILSRCLQLKLRNLAIPEIEQYLTYILKEENMAGEPKALEIIATAANGSMRDALSLTDQAIAFSNGLITATTAEQMLGISDDKSVIALLQAIHTNNSSTLVNLCERLNVEGANLENLLEQINYALFQIGLAQLSPQPQLSNELQELAKSISLQSCQLYFEISNLGLEQIRKIDNKYPIFVMSLLRMVAFSIGSSQDKQIIVSANDCITNVNKATTILTEATDHETQPPESPLPMAESNKNLHLPTKHHFDGNWLGFVKSIDLDTISSDIATVIKTSQFSSNENNQLQFSIHKKFEPLVTKECINSIKQILFTHYNEHFELSFNFSEEEQQQSFSSHKAKEKATAQKEAEESINNDPIIQDLLNNFSAKIVPDSIKPI